MEKNNLMKLTIIVILSALFLFACDSESTTKSSLTLAQQLQQAMDRGLRNYDGKGISAAIIFPSGEA
jgi:hypothetical protein